MKRFALAFVLCVVSASSYAEIVKARSTVEYVQVNANGGLQVTLTTPTGAGCYDGGAKVKVYTGENGVTESGVDRMLSTLLTAKATETSVDVWFDDSNRNCMVKSVKLLDF